MYKFSRNLIVLLGTSISSSLVAFLFTAYAIQKLTIGEFGKFSTIQIFVSSLAVITELGVTQVAIREIAQKKSQTSYIAGNLLAIKTILGIIGAVVTVLVAYILQYDLSTQLLISIYSISLIFLSISNAAVAIFSGHENMVFATVVTWGTILGNTLSILLLFLGYKLPHIILLTVASSGVATITSLILLNRFFCVKDFLTIDIVLWRKYLVSGLPFGLMAIMGSIGVSVGPIMLSRIVGESEVGYYNAVMKIVNILNLLIMAYNSAVYPVFSRLFTNSPDKLYKSYTISLKLAISLGLPLTVGLTVLADKLMLITFPRYAFATSGLQILVWFWLFSLLATPVLNVLYAENKERDAFAAMLISVVICLIFNLLLIPNFGFMGVCIALVSLTMVQFSVAYFKIAKLYKINRIDKLVVKALLISMVIAILGVMCHIWNLFFIILCMVIIWIILFVFLQIFDKEEWETLVEIPVLSKLNKLNVLV